jgi:hypothetical protein
MNGATFLAGFISAKDFTFLMMSGGSFDDRSRCGSGFTFFRRQIKLLFFLKFNLSFESFFNEDAKVLIFT